VYMAVQLENIYQLLFETSRILQLSLEVQKIHIKFSKAM
jgi:hypothetical protein